MTISRALAIGMFLLAVLVIALLGGCPGDGNGGNGTQANGGDDTGDTGGVTQPEGIPFASEDGGVPSDAALVDLNNRGVGEMGFFAYDAACATFEEVVEQAPNWIDAQVNLAIATLNRQFEDDESEALERLERTLEIAPEHLRARYSAAILLRRAGREDDARGHFLAVADADPDDPHAAYWAGQIVEREDNETALDWYHRAIDRDPYFRSPYYRISQVLQRSGRGDEATPYFEAFQKLESNPRAHTAKTVYTKMGRKAEVLAVDLVGPPPAIADGPIFEDAASLLGEAGATITWNDDERTRPISVTACDINGDGTTDLFLADALRHDDGANNGVLLQTDDGWTIDTTHILASISDVNAAVWGDYDNDGQVDVYLLRRGPNHLWRQTSPGTWENVTGASGADGGDADTVDGLFVDTDHDGDLDIICVNADGPNELLNNDRDGGFTSIAAEQGLDGGDRASRQVLTADLDSDRDLDIIVVNDEAPHAVYINDRLWTYHESPDATALVSADIVAVVAADGDADGRVELWTVDGDGGVSRWDRDDADAWGRTGGIDGVTGGKQIMALDFDGDGRSEIAVAGDDGWSIVASSGDVLSTTTAHGLAGWAALATARGPAIVGVPTNRAPIIAAPGSGRHAFALLSLTGMQDTAQSLRSNSSGIGATIAARAGSSWSMADTLRRNSGPGHGLQPVTVGLAGATRLDFVMIDWSDGVFQTELALAAGTVHVIPETQRQVSSCPIVFTWNGEAWTFVTDVLGVGGIGYFVAPGTYSNPRPWEGLLLPHGALAPIDDDRYALRIAEPMEESCYLDAAFMVAWDLPPGWKMVLDERMQVEGPAPSGDAVFYRTERMPSRVTNDRDEDVTSRVAMADLEAAPVGALDTRFIGYLAGTHALTLEFDDQIGVGPGEPWLVADGWVEYPYGQTNFAAWQAGVTLEAPTIEARGSDGRWHVVLERFGYPAGMPRRMAVPLTTLPRGADALRISTTQEIYWDRLSIVYAADCPQAQKFEMPMRSATLEANGFQKRTTGAQRTPWYHYDERVPLWDTRLQSGWYTKLGGVERLVGKADDALAIIGPGEEIELVFDAPIASVREGWSRSFVLELAGWCKDVDLFTKDGETLGPLPARGEGSRERDALHAEFNTRYRSGRE